MTLYRLYFVDSDGHIHSAEDVECPSDRTALTVAATLLSAQPVVEVWEGARVVGRIDRTTLAPGWQAAAPTLRKATSRQIVRLNWQVSA